MHIRCAGTCGHRTCFKAVLLVVLVSVLGFDITHLYFLFLDSSDLR